MRTLLVYAHVFIVSLFFVFPSVSSADMKWLWESGEKKWLPQFEMTARPGNDGLHGMQLDPFIPIVQNDVSLFFLNVKGNLFWNHGDLSEEINVGGGYRRLMGDGGWILGGYGYYDYLESEYDNEFNQGTLGIEALAWNWEARVNGYIAEDDSEFAPEAGGATASLVGNVLLMDSAAERALSGLDAEVGWRLPFFGDDGALSDTRLYAGGFYFDADGVDPITGPMTRFESRIWEVPFLPAESRLTLGTEYRWDDVRHHDITGLIAVRIPLGAPARTEPLTNVERRMTDRVVRDVSIVTSTNSSYTENVRTRTGVVVGEAYFFDDEDPGDGSFESPTSIWDAAEHPLGGDPENLLLIGLDRTGDIDLDDGEGTVYLYDGQIMMGGGTQLPVWGVDSGQMAMFTAPGAGPATLYDEDTGLQLAYNNTIAGLGFRDMGTAISLDLDADSTMADIYNNRFWDLGEFTGVDVYMDSDSSLTLYLTENRFRNAGTGLHLATDASTFQAVLDVRGNHFEHMETGLDIDLRPNGADGASTFALTAAQNTFIDLTSGGIETYVDLDGGDYTHTANLSENTFIENDWDDYELQIVAATSPDEEVLIDVTMANNHSTGGENLADIDIDPIPEGLIDIEIVDNVAAFMEDHAIWVDINGGPDVEALISRNEINGEEDEDGDGIHLEIRNSENVDLIITENTLSNINDDGIDVRVEDSGDTTLTISDNSITGAGDGEGKDNGMEIDLVRVGDDVGNTIEIRRNTLQIIDDDGIDIDVTDGYDTAVTIADNLISGAGNDCCGDDGIEVGLHNVGNSPDTNEITISHNTLEFIDGDGIDVGVSDGVHTEVQIAGNLVRYIEEEGIEVDFDAVGDGDSGRNTILINERNTLEFIDKDGIEVDVTNCSDDTTVEVLDNSLAFIGEDGDDDEGIEVHLYSTGHDVGNEIRVHENTIANVVGGADGIKVEVYGGHDTDLLVADNELSNIDDDGIDVEFDDVGHNLGNTITIDGRNTVDRAGDDGIDVKLTSLDAEWEETTLTIGDNTINDSGENGIEIDIDPTNNAEVAVDNNTVARSGGDGIEVDIDGSDYNVVTITGNDVSSSGDDGIDVDIFGEGDIGPWSDSNVVTISGNKVANSGEKGIEVDVTDDSWDNDVTIESNQISMSGEHGIEIDIEGSPEDVPGYGSDNNEFVVRNNEISTSGENGIDVWVDWGDNDSNLLQIGGNTIESVEDGIQIDDNSTGDDTVLSSADGNNSVSLFSDEAADISGDFGGTTLQVNGSSVP